MAEHDYSRRDFERLALAAFAGFAAGCQQAAPVAKAEEKNPLLDEPHVCRGLNTCKGNGSDSCAGLSQCATESARHECASNNACRGQGGCGNDPGENSCKGKGGCSVPLMEGAWTRARSRFEELMAQAGRKVGPAPAPLK